VSRKVVENGVAMKKPPTGKPGAKKDEKPVAEPAGGPVGEPPAIIGTIQDTVSTVMLMIYRLESCRYKYLKNEANNMK